LEDEFTLLEDDAFIIPSKIYFKESVG